MAGQQVHGSLCLLTNIIQPFDPPMRIRPADLMQDHVSPITEVVTAGWFKQGNVDIFQTFIRLPRYQRNNDGVRNSLDDHLLGFTRVSCDNRNEHVIGD